MNDNPKLYEAMKNADLQLLQQFLYISKLNNTKLFELSHIAIKYGSLKILRYLLEESQFVMRNKIQSYDLLSLKQALDYGLSEEKLFELAIIAIMNGQFKILRYLYEEKKVDVNASYGLALTEAIEYGHFKIARYLIEKAHADAHALLETPFLIAAKFGRFKILRYLVEKHNVDIHINNDQAIIKAAQSGKISILEYLTDKGLNLRTDNDAAVLGAAKGGNVRMLKHLKSKGLNLHTNNDKAIVIAAKAGHLHVVKFLNRQKLDIHTKDNKALRYAFTQQFHVASYLMAQGCYLSDIEKSHSLEFQKYQKIENALLPTAHPRVHKFPLSQLARMIKIKNNRIKKHEVMEMIYCTYNMPQDIVFVLATVMLGREFKPHQFYLIPQPTTLNLDITKQRNYYSQFFTPLPSTWLALIAANQVENAPYISKE